MRILGTVTAAIAAIGLCSTTQAAQDRTLMLNNSSGAAVTTFKVTPVDGSSAQIDVLGTLNIAEGEMLKVTIPSSTDQCVFDLEIGFSDGSNERREAVDFCNTDGYIIEK